MVTHPQQANEQPSIFDVLTGTAGKDRGPVHVVLPGVLTLTDGGMDVHALRDVASELMTRICSRTPLISPTRTTVRAEVIYAINERGGLDGKSRRFIGDYLMAQFGYGGGL